ncbi:MAG: IS21-like element helper ATPase IstB [Fluviibacter phosphoraccumulans]|jgi:DNA replication protein DnaC
MLLEQTMSRMHALRLPGMAQALEEQYRNAAIADLGFDERLAMLVDREHSWRENRRMSRLLQMAKLKSSQACVEDIQYGQGRQLDKSLMAQLGTCQWIRQHQNLVLTGATGCGKTWLACAMGNAACRQGLSVLYVRTPRLFEELRIAHGDGSFGKRLVALAKTDLLILDDWGLAPLTQSDRNDLLEVLDDRVGSRSTLITSQLPSEHWHAYLDDPTLADAILDRVLHAAHKIALSGESLRKSVNGVSPKRDRLG